MLDCEAGVKRAGGERKGRLRETVAAAVDRQRREGLGNSHNDNLCFLFYLAFEERKTYRANFIHHAI
jgi:hypothetical protein